MNEILERMKQNLEVFKIADTGSVASRCFLGGYEVAVINFEEIIKDIHANR